MSPTLPGSSERLDVRKTFKLYVGGAFVRSESGHTFVATDSDGASLGNVANASRKDARNAVTAARQAFAGWSGATAYHRGQVLYRVAEVMEGRREQLLADVRAAEGVSSRVATRTVDAAVDRMVWYAGWTDKVAQVLGSTNPVAGPYFDFSMPEPTGVVAVLAPQQSSLLGLVSVVAPVVATGNTCVVAASAARPVPAVTLSEVLATSDVPGGVVNVLTGDLDRTAPTLAAHRDVNAVDLVGASGEVDRCRDLEEAAAGNLKRVRRAADAEPDWFDEPGLDPLRAFLEIKTVWHPVGV